MRRSQNETLTLFIRAARGGGLPGGAAEDVGRAGLWLARRNYDGAAAVLAAIGGAKEAAAPRLDGGRARFDGAAVAVCGMAAMEYLAAGIAEKIELKNVAAPLLLLGFAGLAAEDYGVSTGLRLGGGGVIFVSAEGTAGGGRPLAGAAEVWAAAGQPATTPPGGVRVRAAAWRRLAAAAEKFYVPANVGNAANAGAGLVDAD